jgi:hypothetical protein
VSDTAKKGSIPADTYMASVPSPDRPVGKRTSARKSWTSVLSRSGKKRDARTVNLVVGDFDRHDEKGLCDGGLNEEEKMEV